MTPVTSKANGWQLDAGRDSEEKKMETDGAKEGGGVLFSVYCTPSDPLLTAKSALLHPRYHHPTVFLMKS